MLAQDFAILDRLDEAKSSICENAESKVAALYCASKSG
jgi:hypothetical protein